MDHLALSSRKRLAFAVLLSVCCMAPANAADMLSVICNNQVVSVGDREGVVLTKCGKPLSRSGGTAAAGERRASVGKKTAQTKPPHRKTNRAVKKTQKAGAEIWTYNMDGSYRFLIFEEGRLTGIEAGGLAN